MPATYAASWPVDPPHHHPVIVDRELAAYVCHERRPQRTNEPRLRRDRAAIATPRHAAIAVKADDRDHTVDDARCDDEIAGRDGLIDR